jgi:[protein-PII] uridylyltransferase
MNRYGILGQYIPAFGKIVGQMQHDLFHVYTVDEHTLNVLANLRRFSKPELKQEFPLCNDLFENFDKPHLLYIAALFHDIAKGRGGDHSILGRVDAKRFCLAHQLPKQDTALVTWLVEAHLQMSRTAQKSDLSDPSIIEQFANYVKDETRLTALYLLTVADIRGTSPKVWNEWKANLLEKLFLETRSALNNVLFSIEQVVKQRQHEATEKLSQYGLNPESYKMFWQNAGEAYFTRYTSDEVAWQSRLLTPHTLTDTPIVRARLSTDGDGIQVMTYLKDQDDLFARICNFFDRISYSIGHATVYTTDHDYALNTFIILDQEVKHDSYSNLLKLIENDLFEKIQSSTPLDAPLKGRVDRQIKHMPIKAKIDIEACRNKSFHTLDIVTSDTPGLLANIAFIFLKQNIDLHYAKINTLGNRAEDSFLISGRREKTLTKRQLILLKQDLLNL